MGQTAEEQPEEYWFNMKTGLVEKGKQSAAVYRVGPFQTAGEAEVAMQLLKQRSEAWKTEDEAAD